MVTSPLVIDIRPRAVEGLAGLLADGRISAGGRVAVAVGPGQGERIARGIGPSLRAADVFHVTGSSVDAAGQLAGQLRQRSYDALVGIGGGRTLDVTKYAAARVGLPMVSVATNLAHDGIASPVSILDFDGGRGSFGVPMPIAVVVDLDYVRSSPVRMVRSGIGDVVSNLSAIADWLLAAQARMEPVDGLAVTFARTAAEALLHRHDGIDSDDFLTALAEALVLSGMAMAVAGTSRPCSGGCHEISHAIDQLFPGKGSHGEQVGLGALFTFFLREDWARAEQIDACLRRHGLPRLPRDLDLDDDQFVDAVLLGPSTRPDRYTILEHLDLDERGVREAVKNYVETFDR